MTARQLLAASLKALFHAHGVTAVEAAKATGIDNATISKFQLPNSQRSRWPRAEHFDALATFFRVEPYVLLKPDHALGQRRDSVRHTAVAHTPGNFVDSASPTSAEGGPLVQHPDQELLAALLAYWDDMPAAARLELVGHGHRLRAATARPAGFQTG